MEIEVVLGEVGEDRRGEVDRVGAVEVQRMRGHLHHARPVARVEHLGEGALQIDGLRRRAQDLVLDPADHALHRAQQAGLAPVGFEQRPDEERRGGLAVGPGDADGRQARRRIPVEARGDRRHRGAHGGDPDLGTPRFSGRSTTSAAAPRATASAAKSCPSRV